jgi:phage tail-like protein
MPIQDLSGNPLVTITSPMIGFQSLPADADALNLDMYRFIINVIREEDQINGNQFLQRFLKGPQAVWKDSVDKALFISALWDVATCPDQYLQYLKNIVGWTDELKHITDRLDDLTLRRLIAASVPYWKRKGPENALIAILSLTTGARVRIWNWFDYRIVLDENAFGEDWNGYDPWMISLPGPPNTDENRSNVRIVDDGTLDRILVRALCGLARPVNERIEISYIGFLDLFRIDDDLSQWEPTTGIVVVDGKMDVPAGDESVIAVPGAADWSDYVVTARLLGSGIFQAYRTGAGDYYYAELSVATNQILVGVVVGGVPTVLATINMAGYLVMLDANLHYALRLELSPESGQTRFNVYFESVLLASLLNPMHAQGTVAFASSVGMEVDEAELFFNPLETDTLDINT